jgi:hypothetical protein
MALYIRVSGKEKKDGAKGYKSGKKAQNTSVAGKMTPLVARAA